MRSFLTQPCIPFPVPRSGQCWFTLQRQNAENLKIFPEMEYRGLIPNFHIHVCVRELYIPRIGLPILLQEICGPILGLYKSLTEKWMWNWDWGRAIPRKGMHKRDCRCSVVHSFRRCNKNSGKNYWSPSPVFDLKFYIEVYI
jgi:hypothetical protein